MAFYGATAKMFLIPVLSLLCKQRVEVPIYIFSYKIRSKSAVPLGGVVFTIGKIADRTCWLSANLPVCMMVLGLNIVQNMNY